MRHPSTPVDRVVWIGRLVAEEGRYGAVTALSRETGVPRQTLTIWRGSGRRALERALTPVGAPTLASDPELVRAVLTLLVCGHASLRGIQACLVELWGRHVSLGAIHAIVAEAGRKARAQMETLAPAHPGALALDELFNGDAQAAYLSAVDARDGVVWATAGPVPADAESWTLLLWGLQERGGTWPLVLHDGGHAAAAGAAVVDPAAACARDVWHVLARWGQTQHRLDVRVAEARAKLAIRGRYDATVAAGQPWRGKRPATSTAVQAAVLVRETGWAEAVRFLGQEVRRALEVVVLLRERVQGPPARRQEVLAALALLAEVAQAAPLPVRTDLERLHAHTAQALPGLLRCAELLAPVETAVAAVLGAAGVGLVGWAWQRRTGLDLEDGGVVAGLPPAWQAAARVLLHAWSGAVRSTSLAESWHSLVRAHVAVHRGLPPGVLALLAIWHNYRVVARGTHAGTSPIQRSGLVDAPTDWLTVLGYPPPTPRAVPRPLPAPDSVFPAEVAA